MRSFFLWLLLAPLIHAACPNTGPAKTTIADTLTDLQGNPRTGSFKIIQRRSFISQDACTVPPGVATVTLGAGGTFTVNVVPTLGSTPTISYEIDFSGLNQNPATAGINQSSIWVVPLSLVTLNLQNVTLNTPPPPVAGTYSINLFIPPNPCTSGWFLQWNTGGFACAPGTGGGGTVGPGTVGAVAQFGPSTTTVQDSPWLNDGTAMNLTARALSFKTLASPQISPTVALGAAGVNTPGAVLVSFAYNGLPMASYTSDIWDNGSPITVNTNEQILVSAMANSTQPGVNVTGKIVCVTKVGFDANNPVFYNVGTVGPTVTTFTINTPDSAKTTICPTLVGQPIQVAGAGTLIVIDEFGQTLEGCFDNSCQSTAYTYGQINVYAAGVSPGGSHFQDQIKTVGGNAVTNLDVKENIPTVNGSILMLHSPNDAGNTQVLGLRTAAWPAGSVGRKDVSFPFYAAGMTPLMQVGALGNQAADRSAGIAATTLLNVMTTGDFELHFEIRGNSTCATPGPAAVTFGVIYTDDLSTKTFSALPMTVNAAATRVTSFPIGVGTNNAASGTYDFRALVATNIQITVGYTACTTGTGTYRVSAVLTQISQ